MQMENRMNRNPHVDYYPVSQKAPLGEYVTIGADTPFEVDAQGYSQEDAQTEAARWVARPGTSEHQLGLAVDIVAESYPVLDAGQEDTPEQQWLMANSYRYGFVLRYPEGKSYITGIGYEPWHYRYVGVEAAEQMYRDDLCLEEYLTGL